MRFKNKKLSLISLILIVCISISLNGCKKIKEEPVKAAEVASKATVLDNSDNYVGTYADDKVSQSEFYFFYKQIKSSMESSATQSGQTDLVKYWTTAVDGKMPQDTAIENATKSIENYKLQLFLAKKAKIKLADEDNASFEKDFNNIVTSNGGAQAIEDRLNKDLGISTAQYKKIALNFELIKKYTKSLEFPKDKVDKLYNENKDKYNEVTVIHVLFKTTDDDNKPLPADKIALAKKNADDTLKKVQAGEDISKLAKELSQDPGVKENNGQYKFKKGNMVPEFESWAFSNKPGDAGIVKTSYGYHVMKKLSETSIEEQKKAAQNELQEKKLTENMDKVKTESKYVFTKNTSVFNSLKL